MLDLGRAAAVPRRCSPAGASACCSRSRRPAPATPWRWPSCSSAATRSPSGARRSASATRETVEDVARTLAVLPRGHRRRVFDHGKLERMAAVGAVPVVNLLSDAPTRAGPGRPADHAPALRQLDGLHGGLGRRRQQRVPLAGHRCGHGAGMHVRVATPPATSRRRCHRDGAGRGGRAPHQRPGRGRQASPTPCAPTCGRRWARRTRPSDRRQAFAGFTVDAGR